MGLRLASRLPEIAVVGMTSVFGFLNFDAATRNALNALNFDNRAGITAWDRRDKFHNTPKVNCLPKVVGARILDLFMQRLTGWVRHKRNHAKKPDFW